MKGAITLFQQVCEDVSTLCRKSNFYADRTSMTKSDKVRHSILKNVCTVYATTDIIKRLTTLLLSVSSLTMENDKNVNLTAKIPTLKRTAIPNKESVNMFNLINWKNPTGMYH